MEKYEINENTAAIIGVNDNLSKVIEGNKEYFVGDSSFSIMENSCEYFGSTCSGRIIGSRKMLGANYKVPIIVEESRDIIFFPISEIDNPKCTWISLNWFDRVEEDYNKNYIYLKSGKKIPTKVSIYSIENQVLRSSKLNLILNNRKKGQNNL